MNNSICLPCDSCDMSCFFIFIVYWSPSLLYSHRNSELERTSRRLAPRNFTAQSLTTSDWGFFPKHNWSCQQVSHISRAWKMWWLSKPQLDRKGTEILCIEVYLHETMNHGKQIWFISNRYTWIIKIHHIDLPASILLASQHQPLTGIDRFPHCYGYRSSWLRNWVATLPGIAWHQPARNVPATVHQVLVNYHDQWLVDHAQCWR